MQGSAVKTVLTPVAMLALSACAADRGPESPIQLERNTEFDGAELRFFVSLEDGTEASVSTPDDLYGEPVSAPTPMPGHQAQAMTFLKETDTGTSVAHALLSWAPQNPADYLAFGWWAEFPGQKVQDLSLEGSVQYAIIDGPEIDHGIGPQVPIGGVATYTGQAGGLYTYSFGNDWDEHEGGWVIDEYQGVLTLTADFTDGTVWGCIGCVGDIDTKRAHFGVFLGRDPLDRRGLARDYELHLASAIIREDGQFERERVTVRHPERAVMSSEGFWGGALSSRQDSDGNPRLAAGFSSVGFEESDGSEGQFVGSLLGLSDAFLRDEESTPLPGNDG